MAFTPGPLHGKEVIHEKKRREGCQTWAQTKVGAADGFSSRPHQAPSPSQCQLLWGHWGPGLLRAAWEGRRKHPYDGRGESQSRGHSVDAQQGSAPSLAGGEGGWDSQTQTRCKWISEIQVGPWEPFQPALLRAGAQDMGREEATG